MTARVVDYFQTDDLGHRIGRETARSGVLAIAGTVFAMVVRLGSLLVLARLLSPRDFGLFGMAMVPTAIIMIFRQFGFPTAIVQYSGLRHEHASQLFWINAKWIAILVGAATLSIPLFSLYFGEPGLFPLAFAAILSAAIFATSSIHAGLLRRRMRFAVVFAENLSGASCGAVIGIGCALAGFGAWALVLQQAATDIGALAVRWLSCRWRPSSPGQSSDSDHAAVRSLLQFGRNTMAVRVLDQTSIHLHTVIVGGISSVATLGLYQNALRWAGLPIELVGTLGRVTVSGLSRLRDSANGYRDYARTTMLILFSVLLPIITVIMIDTRALVLLLLGPPWLDAVPFLQLLAAAMCADCLMRITRWYLLAEGQTSWLVRWSLFRNGMSVIGMLLGMAWGPSGVATGFAVASWLCVAPNVVGLITLTQLRWQDAFDAMGRPAFACGASCGVVAFGLRFCDSAGMAIPFAAVVSLYALAYSIFWMVLPGGLRELRAMFDLAHDRPSTGGASQTPVPKQGRDRLEARLVEPRA